MARKFRELFGDRVSLDNTWGATEVSIDSTYYTCGPDIPDRAANAVSIGQPIDNNAVYVLDGRLDHTPPGMIGELYIGGAAWPGAIWPTRPRRQQLSCPTPFQPGRRMYRTGDWGRRRADGILDFVGRRDRQVEIRGVRIELAEVEAALLACSAVTAVAVISWSVSPGDKRLAAYAEVKPGSSATAATIRDHLHTILPGYVIPTSITVLDELPRHGSGKLDPSRLPAPDPAAVREGPYVAPGIPTEQALAEIWSAVLQIDRIGVDDDFFALGGHSLLATLAMGRMRRSFDTQLPFSLLFEAPTIAQAAARVKSAVMTEIESMTEAEVLRLSGPDHWTRLPAPSWRSDTEGGMVSADPEYKVVINDEEQYSIWPAGKVNAPGWSDEGTCGSKDECLAHIEKVWVDMRPLSLRRRMADASS